MQRALHLTSLRHQILFHKFVEWDWAEFGKVVPEEHKACAFDSFDSNEFWTYAVGGYLPFKTYLSGRASDVDDGSGAENSSSESDSSDVATAQIRILRRRKLCGRSSHGGGKAPRRTD